jgi:type II restriction enzyme
MTYYERIRELTRTVPVTLVDFGRPRDPARTPTQASSNFITNKEQGDWAENLVFRAINETSKNFVAVKYGKSDDLVAGEEGFDTFYQEFQDELDTIGKRPDLLIFKKEDFIADLGYDISQVSHHTITGYVKKAIAGIEVRSSAFLIDKYEEAMQAKTDKYIQIALETKDKILKDYSDILQHPKRQKYITFLENLNAENLTAIKFKTPGWYSTERLKEANSLFGVLSDCISKLSKRSELSITVKKEDLQVVYKWIEAFNIPHYYFQVFFDKIKGISFEDVLKIISNPDEEDVIFKVERNKKNQDKPTIHIYSSSSMIIASKVDEPIHESVRKEMDRGRLLFYVTFNGGTAYLNVDNLINILGIDIEEF